MRSEGQIRQQLKQVSFRHLQRLLRENFRQRPEGCSYNRDFILDGRILHVCGYQDEPGDPRLTPCDSRLPGGPDLARQCPLWKPLQTKEEIKQEFLALLQKDRGTVAAEYPDIAALLWVLDSAGEPPSVAEMDDTAEALSERDPDPPPALSAPTPALSAPPPAQSWWTRLWGRGGRR